MYIFGAKPNIFFPIPYLLTFFIVLSYIYVYIFLLSAKQINSFKLAQQYLGYVDLNNWYFLSIISNKLCVLLCLKLVGRLHISNGIPNLRNKRYPPNRVTFICLFVMPNSVKLALIFQTSPLREGSIFPHMYVILYQNSNFSTNY